MAARGDEVRLRYTAEIADLRKKLASIPDITGAEARKAVKQLDQAVRAVEKSQTRALKSARLVSQRTSQYATATAAASRSNMGMARSASLVAQQLPDVASQLSAGTPPMTIFIQQGGQVVQQMDMMALASRGLSAVASPAGLAIAGIGTAAVVVANQVHQATESARQYEARLEELGTTTRQVIAAQNALRLATGDVGGFVSDLRIQTALLTGDMSAAEKAMGDLDAKLAKELAPNLRDAGLAYAENEERISKLEERIKSGSLAFEAEAAAVGELSAAMAARGGLASALDEIKGLQVTGRAAIADYVLAMAEKGAATTETARATVQAVDIERERAAIQRQLLEATTSLTDAEITRQLQLQQIAELEDAGIVTAIEGAQLRLQATSALRAAEAESAAERLAQIERQEEAEARAAQARERMAAQARAQARAQADYILGQTQSGITSMASIVEAAGDGSEEAATRAARAARSAAVFQAGVSTAGAVVKGMEMFGPPPSPAGIAAITAAGLIGGLQVAAIAAEPLPTYAAGGIARNSPGSDAFRANLHAGEGVLTRRGMEALDQLNSGQPPAQGSGAVVMQYDHRAFDLAISETVRRGGRLRRAISGLSSRPGHSRRSS